MNSHMPMKTRRRAQLELLAHEFEAIPKRVDLGQHLDYVLMVLNDKIEKGQLQAWTKPKKYISWDAIFEEEATVPLPVEKLDYQRPLSQFYVYQDDPKINKYLREIRNRDLNLHRCMVTPSYSKNPFTQYLISYPSSVRKNTATPLIPIGLFAAWVSSANHFKNILKRKQQIHREAAKKRKRDIKAAAKSSKPPRKLTDGEIGNNGLECVSRNVLGVPVNGWVKPDERASFLCQERKRIELEYARNPDSSDSEDTLSDQSDPIFN